MFRLELHILWCILEGINQVIYSGKLINLDTLFNCGINENKRGSGAEPPEKQVIKKILGLEQAYKIMPQKLRLFKA